MLGCLPLEVYQLLSLYSVSCVVICVYYMRVVVCVWSIEVGACAAGVWLVVLLWLCVCTRVVCMRVTSITTAVRLYLCLIVSP